MQQTLTLESLVEEHSGENGVLNNISNKKEATSSLNEFYELAWESLDVSGYNEFFNLTREVDSLSEDLSILANETIFQRAINDKGNLTLTAIRALVKEVDGDEKRKLEEYLGLDSEIKSRNKRVKILRTEGMEMVDSALANGSNALFLDETRIVRSYLDSLKNVETIKDRLKVAKEALDRAVFQKYPKLSEAEIKSLIVEDKWLATLENNIVAEIERVTQQLANRVKELEERYAEPLPAITRQVEALSEKVAGHLKAMGLEWTL